MFVNPKILFSAAQLNLIAVGTSQHWFKIFCKINHISSVVQHFKKYHSNSCRIDISLELRCSRFDLFLLGNSGQTISAGFTLGQLYWFSAVLIISNECNWSSVEGNNGSRGPSLAPLASPAWHCVSSLQCLSFLYSTPFCDVSAFLLCCSSCLNWINDSSPSANGLL